MRSANLKECIPEIRIIALEIANRARQRVDLANTFLANTFGLAHAKRTILPMVQRIVDGFVLNVLSLVYSGAVRLLRLRQNPSETPNNGRPGSAFTDEFGVE
ncbi:MAG: hypothetical protein JO307_20815 [Bryobacterales bacterium]|nr:hypothetical protein [Bryobacterales bacterium]